VERRRKEGGRREGEVHSPTSHKNKNKHAKRLVEYGKKEMLIGIDSGCRMYTRMTNHARSRLSSQGLG